MFRRLSVLAAGALLLTSIISAAPVSAQGRSAGCTQTTSGGGGSASGTLLTGGNRSDSRAVLTGVIAAAVQNVSILDNNQLLNNVNALNSSNVQLVCLNDVLNENDVRILSDILNESPILNDSLNNTLRNSTFLNNLLQGANIVLLNNVQVVAVNLGTGQFFLLNPTG